MADFYVYCWTNLVNGKRYVGKGRGRRAWDHLKPCNRSPISSAIAKYGRDAFALYFLGENLSEDEAFRLEKQSIADLGSKVPRGYNLTDGGEGVVGYKHTPEDNERNRASRLGKKHSEETKRLISMNGRGLPKPKTAEHRAKISKSKTGAIIAPCAVATRFNISAAKLKLSPSAHMNICFLATFGAHKTDIAYWFGVDITTVYRYLRSPPGRLRKAI